MEEATCARLRRTMSFLKEVREVIHRVTSLLDDRSQSSALQVLVVSGKCYPQTGFPGMFQNVVAAGNVMHHEAGTFERPQYVFGLERGKPPAHADSGTSMWISSFT